MLISKNLVEDLMSTTVLFARTDHKPTELSRLFFEMGIHHLPVLNDAGQVLGILSANDVLKAFSYKLNNWEHVDPTKLDQLFKVEELMTPQPIKTISPKDSIWRAAKIFAEYKIHALPVVEKGKLVGIITGSDIIERCAEVEEDVHII